MVFFTTMFTTADVNIHALIAKYGIDKYQKNISKPLKILYMNSYGKERKIQLSDQFYLMTI
jgi:hypothetical protein